MGQYHSSKTRGNGQGFRALKKIQQIGAYNHQKKFRGRRKTAGICRGHEAAGCDCALSDAVICFFMPCGNKAQRIFSLHHGNPGKQKSGAPPHFMALPQEETQKAGKALHISFACAALPSRAKLSVKAALSSPFRGVRRLKDAKKTPSDGGAAGQTVKPFGEFGRVESSQIFKRTRQRVRCGDDILQQKIPFPERKLERAGSLHPRSPLVKKSLFDKQTRRPMEGRRV